MFAPSDFQPSKPPPIQNNRVIGALVLLFFVVLCLLVSIGMDAVVFVPYNATYAITQTWQQSHPTTPRPFSTPRRVSTRSFDKVVSFQENR